MSESAGDAGSRNAERLVKLHEIISTLRTNLFVHERINLSLENKLAIAVEALEKIGQDDWRYHAIAQEALTKIKQ